MRRLTLLATALWLAAGPVKTHLGPPPRGGVRQRRAGAAIIHEVDRRQPFFRQRLLRVRLPDRDQLFGLAVGQRLQQDGVDDAEDRGGRAAAEAQGQDGDGGERRRAPQLAPGESQVASDPGPASAYGCRPRHCWLGRRAGSIGWR